jgi:glycerol uptake facilitator protein
MRKSEFVGELLGTFLLVLFGCGSVAVTVLFDAHMGLMQISLAWGIGVMLAIYATRHLSCAHLNPAVSLAMVASRRMTAKKLPCYLLAQFVGAFIAGLALYLCFGSSIEAFESANGIVRGTPESANVAKMFGEYYNLPGGGSSVTMWLAAGIEAFGTFLLLLMIFSLTEGCNVGRPADAATPVFIGLSVSAIICLLAPLTQAGLNPARDFGPRLVAWCMGWGEAAWPDATFGFFFVYILGPVLGGLAAAALFVAIIEPLMSTKTDACACQPDQKQTARWKEMKTDLIIIGGFLGAGKTTFLKELSRFLAAKKKNVGLITNDQASALVDTAFLRDESGNVVEVSGSCFCCNYNGFMDAVTSLRKRGMDTIIAEPVGSCTDLSATIMQPLKEKSRNDLNVYPLSVFVDPHRLEEILDSGLSGLHPGAVYIVIKQLEEADVIVINKADLLSPAVMQELIGKTKTRFPGKPVLSLSALTGAGLDQWLAVVSSSKASGSIITEVDYDTYAEGEAILGWLNMAVTLEKTKGDWNGFVQKFLDALAERFDAAGFSVAHVKILLEAGGESALGNITGKKNTARLRNAAGNGDNAALTINARVETSPDTLLHTVKTALDKQCSAGGIAYSIVTSNCLSPGRPNPTHRYAAVVA